MKTCAALPFVALLLLALAAGSTPADEKNAEVRLEGRITCARCELGLTKKCASVIVVREQGKDVVYFFDAATNQKYHGEICSEARPGEVTGTVTTVAGKRVVNVRALKFR